MATINVRCNGSGKHVNEVNLDTVLQTTTVTRGQTPANADIPERSVLPCQHCTDGKVVVTRTMIETVQGQ